MRIRFVLTSLVNGGLSAAVERLALALSEHEHLCDVLVPLARTVALDGPVPVVRCISLPVPGAPIEDAQGLSRALAAGGPDLLVVGEGRADLLRLAARIAPTVLHSQLHWAVCADGNRFWGRIGRECAVRAGYKCIIMRPVMGCSGRDRVFSPRYVSEQQRLLELIGTGQVGVVAISSHQAEMILDHGVSSENVAVIPNLGMRMTVSLLRRTSATIQPIDRSSVVFLGRLSREKGAQLLPLLAQHLPPDVLRVFGDGYLAPSLKAHFGSALRAAVSQETVAGLLQWARAIVFPSLWPEPGGIVGIDAQLFGVPLAAFDSGAARDWPHATLFRPPAIEAIVSWALQQPRVVEPRSPHLIARRQASYWASVSNHAEVILQRFVATGRFSARGEPAGEQELQLWPAAT